MVHFGTKLHTNKNPLWAQHYVDYDKLKGIIKKVKKRLNVLREASLPSHSAIVLNSGNINRETGAISENEEYYPADIEQSVEGEPYGERRRAATMHRRANTVDETTGLLFRERSVSGYGAAEVAAKKKRKNKKIYHMDLQGHSSSVDEDGEEEETKSRGFEIELLKENPDSIFVDAIKVEAEKVDKFYRGKIGEIQGRVAELTRAVASLRSDLLDPDVEEDSSTLSKDVLAADSAKRAYRDAYRELKLLNNFTILNYTAFVKILKKHDKATGLKTQKQMNRLLDKYRSGFVDAPLLHELVERVEQSMAKKFFNNNMTVARSELLLKHHKMQSWEMFHIGLRFGTVLVLSFWVIWDVAVDEFMKPNETQLPVEIARIFRGFGVFVFGFWAWSFCLYCWDRDRVNHTYLFEFDPRRAYIWQECLSKATIITIVYLFLLLLYMKIARGEVYGVAPTTARLVPLFLFGFMTCLLIFPLDQTSSILNALVSVVCAPFYEVTFFHSLVGDVLTSLAKPLVDVAFTVCFFFTGEWHRLYELDSPGLDPHHSNCMSSFQFSRVVTPLVISLPLLFRLNQNLRRYHDTGKRFPHLANAGKYLAAHSLVLLGAIHPDLGQGLGGASLSQFLWVSAFMVSTLFTYYWDVTMDWGLGDRKYGWLREHRMILDNRFYYVAIVGDFFLRFTWCLTLIPQVTLLLGSGITSSYFLLFIAISELMRRAVWCVIRVEYEHLYNAQGYRRVDFVPLHFEMAQNPKKHKSKYSVMVELTVFVAIVVAFFIFAFATGDSKKNYMMSTAN